MESDNKRSVFDVFAESAQLPETAETMLVDKYFVDKESASARIFRIYRELPLHYHNECDEHLYVVSGRARMRWGDKLEFVAEAGPGDFIYVPPYVPHQEINASDDQPLSCVLVRSGQEPVVVNLDIPAVEKPEEVYWVDNIHPGPKNR